MADLNIRSALDAIEMEINRGEHGDALAILQNARDALGTDTSASPAPATEPTTDEAKSISDRVHQVRDDLFTVMAVVALIRRAADPDTQWQLNRAASVVVDQLDAACAALELIATDAREPQHKSCGSDAIAIQSATREPKAEFTLTRASDTLEAIDALVNVSISVLRSGCDLGDDLVVVLDGAYEKIVSARSDVDATLQAMEGTAP